MTFNPHGVDLFGEPAGPRRRSPLAQRFESPPFSVLDTRSGDWQERKRAWLALGIRSELGRGTQKSTGERAPVGQRPTYRQIVIPQSQFAASRPNGSYDPRPGREAGEYDGGDAWLASGDDTGASVFDPVLTELCYRWFCPKGGLVLDPFAGGSVRGVVAGLLGLQYHGLELRSCQVDANHEQLAEICPGARVTWRCGDSRELLADAPPADFVFSCPPYGDLERYSDDPRDLSTLSYDAFVEAYRQVIARACARLLPGRFACFVVGDFRDRRTGALRGFVGDTVAAFRAAGLSFHNEAVLVTPVGSLAIRITKQFRAGRKLGKTHQNVLVFAKGDAARTLRLSEE